MLVSLRISFTVLLLLDGHHVERVEGGQHGATHPRCVLPVQGISDDDVSLGILSDRP